jgi:hypothetical protein
MSRFDTIYLAPDTWDFTIDSGNNIAMAQPEYSLAQDVASAVMLFINELWYDTEKGIPYFKNVLGQFPPFSLIISYIENAALTVPGVVTAQCIISEFSNRAITGQILFIDEVGTENGVSF